MENLSYERKLLIIRNGLCYSGELANGYMTRKELQETINHLQNTIDYYNKNKISDEQILSNEKVKEVEYSNHIASITQAKSKEYDHLYVIFDTVNKSLKIGRSKNPKSRLAALQLSTSNKLELLRIVKGQGEMERPVHQKFASKRLASEWFEDCKEIRDYFKI